MPMEREESVTQTLEDDAPTGLDSWALRPARPAGGGVVYDWLEGEILSGRLAPGSKLDLEALEQLSAAPAEDLRDAMIRLSNDGLVRLDMTAALRVSPVSLSDLKDLTATRIIIEGEALRRAIEQGDAGWANRVTAAYSRLARIDPPPGDRPALIDPWEHCNHDFHAALVSACDLNYLKQFSATLYKHHERYRRLSLTRRASGRDVQGEHRALYQAALSRDVPAALAVIADHIGRTADSLTSGINDGSWFGAPAAPRPMEGI